MHTDFVVLLTPPGPGAIAVVRLAGPKTGEFLSRCFSRPVCAGKAVHGNLCDGETVVDDPLVVVHEDGISADLSVHGGPWVVHRVLDLAERNGFEIIRSHQAGDGRDEIEKKVWALLPLAKTELALRWLLAQPMAWGRRARRYSIVPSLRPFLRPPRVAIVGDANVGKSTLANQLFAQERSITADLPGTTRDWVGEIADLHGLAVFLMDTPGLRESSDPIETAAIQGSSAQVAQADLVVLVVDGSQSLAQQRLWADRYPRALVVRNKCDQAKELDAIDPARPHIYTVGTSGHGVDRLAAAIRRRFIRPWRHPRRAVIHDPSNG